MSGILQPPLPRRDALPPSKGTPFYMTGEIAQDLCRLTGLSLDDDGKFLDVSRLPWWDYFRVLWAWVGGNYYCRCTPWPEPKPVVNQCMGCQSQWPTDVTRYGFTIHRVQGGYDGEIVGCTKGRYE